MGNFVVIWLTLCYSFFNCSFFYNPETKFSPEKAFQNHTNKAISWEFDKIKGSKLLFKDGNSFETGLYDLKYIGQIKTDNKAPFLIYSGRDCNECDANISIYFHSPRNGKLKVGQGENSYSYPGKELDYLDNSVLFEATAFYGEVLKGIKGIIWFQRTRQEDGSFQTSVFLAKIAGDKVITENLKAETKQKAETLALNKAGKNKEIKGVVYTSEP